MRRMLKSAIWVFVGVLAGFPIFSMTYYTMVRTSTPQFCASCHEIEFAYNTWLSSSHANNAQGVVADCMDCHLPAPHQTFDFFFAKTWHGAKDVAVHFLEGPEVYDNALNREKAYAAFSNDQCQKCHRNILHMPDRRGAMLAHRSVLYPRPGYEKRCVDCHRNLVHVQRDKYDYKQYRRYTAVSAGL